MHHTDVIHSLNVVILERANCSTLHPSPAPLVVDNIGQYGNISHQPVEGLIKYISPHLASEQPSYASLNLGYR